MPFASALSEHPITASAVGEVAGQLLETLGPAPALAMLFVTPHHAGALEDAAAAIRTILEPEVLLGCAAASVLGDGREVEDGPGVVLWATRSDAAVLPVRLTVVPGADGLRLTGWPDPLPFAASSLVLLADAFSFPADEFFGHLHAAHPGLAVSGGNASAANGPGANRLVLDGAVVSSGAVGALLGPGLAVDAVVSQGCRPIGRPYTVTRAERDVVFELGGEPAYARLTEIANSLSDDEKVLLQSGVHFGVVIDEHKLDYSRGDFLVRNVFGADRATGAIQVGDVVPVGATAQYHVRDADTADEDLRALLDGRTADGALIFTCNGRGVRFFGERDHDASVVADVLDRPATAGFFAAGEFGPIGSRNFVHGYTASIALLSSVPGGSAPAPHESRAH